MDPDAPPQQPQPATPSDPTTPTDPTNSPLTWILDRPALLIAIALIALTTYLYLKAKKLYTQRTGNPPPPIARHTLELLKIAYREDTRPINPRTPWITWTRLATTLTLTTIPLITLKLWIPAILTTLAAIITTLHATTIHKIRRSVTQQMTDVAIGEMTAAAVNVTQWRNLVYPATTIVNHPARYRSSDPSTREKFETNFTASTADSHGWIYTWEPHRNRVICEPTPLLPRKASYPPGPPQHPWDEIPVGVTADGDIATVSLATFPHLLLTGSTGSGKAVECSTKIPTPSGWTTMGDLKPGDQVFDENGVPCTVTWVSDINEDPDLYEVVFSDGSVIEADADHLWFTETRKARVSRWNAAATTAERRCLISVEAKAALEDLLKSAPDDGEITVAQLAALIGVRDTASWLREVADAVGPVGEVQFLVKQEYAEQVVRQKQKVRTYSARECWSALAGYVPQMRWVAMADELAELADSWCGPELVSPAQVGEAIDARGTVARVILRRLGVEPVSKGPGRNGQLLFNAVEVFAALSRAAAESRPGWLVKQPVFAGMAEAAVDGDVVTSIDLARHLGFSDPVRAASLMTQLGVPATVIRMEVELKVPAKTVEKKSPVTRTYNTRGFATAVLERAKRPANDQRHKKTHGSVKTTAEILATLRTDSGHLDHSIPVAKALVLPDVPLPIDPYVLGLWLGDGSSRQGEVCGIDHEVAESMTAAGYEPIGRRVSATVTEHPDFRIWSSKRLHQELKAQGLLQRTAEEGSQKRIPEVYMRAGTQQRRDLLAGLLDTDGTVAPQGTAQFSNTNEGLSRQVFELAVSLGYRATLTSSVKRAPTGTEALAFTVSWTCPDSPFRLARKTQAHAERNQSYCADRNETRFVKEIQKVAPRPARCIQVDSPSRLFLAGEAMIPTHNSVTQRSIMLHAMRSPDWRVVCVDLKRVELSAFKDKKNVLKVAVELEDALAVLRGAESEMHRRYKELEAAGAQKYKEFKPDAPALLVMVDELFALLAMEKTKDEEAKERDMMRAQCTSIISSIARLGRGAGVHLVLATQRPDATILPGELKALALDTPVATPGGWVSMGDLAVGDQVFDERGRPARVTAVSPVYLDSACYRVAFSDGSVFVADGGHLWEVWDQSGGLLTGRRVLSTGDLGERLLSGAGAWVRGVVAPDVCGGGGRSSAGVSLPRRRVVSVEPVGSVPVKCIAVDSPTRLFLAGCGFVPTHNSNLDARIAMGRMDMTPSLMVLDSDRATRTPKIAGRGVLRQGADLIEFQGFWIDPSDLDWVLAQDELMESRGGADADFDDDERELPGTVGGSGGSGPGKRSMKLGRGSRGGGDSGRGGGVPQKVSGSPLFSRLSAWWGKLKERADAHDAGFNEPSGRASRVSQSPVAGDADLSELMAGREPVEYTPMPSQLRNSVAAPGAPAGGGLPGSPPLPTAASPAPGPVPAAATGRGLPVMGGGLPHDGGGWSPATGGVTPPPLPASNAGPTPGGLNAGSPAGGPAVQPSLLEPPEWDMPASDASASAEGEPPQGGLPLPPWMQTP